MAQFKDYSIENDFPQNAVVDGPKFHARIENDPSITTALAGIRISGDNVKVTFQAEPDPAEWTVVDGLVSGWSDEMLAEAKERLNLAIRKHRVNKGVMEADTWTELEAEFNSAATAITNVNGAADIPAAEAAAAAYIGS